MFTTTRHTAVALAGQVAADFPPSLQSLSGRKALDMFQRAAAELRRRVQEIQRQQRMGIIRRIVFARAFQNELLRLGYEGALVRQLMGEALASLTLGVR